MSVKKLPEGWQETEIGDIASIISGGTPKSGVAENFAPPGEGIAWLTPADLSGYKDKYISHGARDLTTVGYSSCSAKLMPKGTILFSSRAPIGYVAIAANEIATNQGFKSFAFTSDIFPDYAYYFLRNIRHVAEEMGTGTTFKEISGSSAKTLPFVLAPLAEQKIIAEKLETLLAQVDTTKARLEKIPQLLKRFRQALMAAAVSGHLTEAWRNKHCNIDINNISVSKYKPNNGLFEQAKSSVRAIPSSWQIIPSAHLIEYITSGSRGWADYYSTEGALFLRMSNVRYNTTKLDLDDLQFVNLPGSVEGKRSHVKVDDLIISLTADVGRVARIDKDLGEAYINQHLALVRPTKNIDSEYFALCIASQNIGVKQIQFFKKGATKAGLGLDDIRSLAIPFPPLSEQQEIVRRVEQLFVYADTIEKQVNNALTRVNNLTQSILAKAFRGELSSQWRAENPELITGENSAAALLKKIKDEREAIKRLPKPKRSAIKKKTGKRMSKQIIKVVEALTQAGEPLSGQQLLAAAGYPGDSNTDDLEKFFLDIRQALIVEKSIVKLERSEDGQDWFSLAEVGSNE